MLPIDRGNLLVPISRKSTKGSELLLLRSLTARWGVYTFRTDRASVGSQKEKQSG